MSDLAERLRELDAKATPGEWFVGGDIAGDCPDHYMSGLALIETGRTADPFPARLMGWHNAALICALRNELPAILAALEDARWISVTERLPLSHETVIVDGGIAYWLAPCQAWPDGQWFTVTATNYPGLPIQWEVTHWKPFPKLDAARKEGA